MSNPKNLQSVERIKLDDIVKTTRSARLKPALKDSIQLQIGYYPADNDIIHYRLNSDKKYEVTLEAHLDGKNIEANAEGEHLAETIVSAYRKAYQILENYEMATIILPYSEILKLS